MKDVPDSVKIDLENWEKDSSAFPKSFSRTTLDFMLDQNDESVDEFLKFKIRIENTIRDTGIQILGIFPDPDHADDYQERFTYSIGANRVDLPEMLTFYPSIDTAHWVINRLYQRMLDNDLELPTDPEKPVFIDDVLSDLSLALVLLTDEQRIESYDRFTVQVDSADVPIMQVVMPYPSGEWRSDYIPPGYLPKLSLNGQSLFS